MGSGDELDAASLPVDTVVCSQPRPQIQTRRPSIGSVLGRLKSTTKKGQSEAWVMIDVEVKPTIQQWVVDEDI